MIFLCLTRRFVSRSSLPIHELYIVSKSTDVPLSVHPEISAKFELYLKPALPFLVAELVD